MCAATTPVTGYRTVPRSAAVSVVGGGGGGVGVGDLSSTPRHAGTVRPGKATDGTHGTHAAGARVGRVTTAPVTHGSVR
jgi:hypothetical protein